MKPLDAWRWKFQRGSESVRIIYNHQYANRPVGIVHDLPPFIGTDVNGIPGSENNLFLWGLCRGLSFKKKVSTVIHGTQLQLGEESGKGPCCPSMTAGHVLMKTY